MFEMQLMLKLNSADLPSLENHNSFKAIPELTSKVCNLKTVPHKRFNVKEIIELENKLRTIAGQDKLDLHDMYGYQDHDGVDEGNEI